MGGAGTLRAALGGDASGRCSGALEVPLVSQLGRRRDATARSTNAPPA